MSNYYNVFNKMEQKNRDTTAMKKKYGLSNKSTRINLLQPKPTILKRSK